MRFALPINTTYAQGIRIGGKNFGLKDEVGWRLERSEMKIKETLERKVGKARAWKREMGR